VTRLPLAALAALMACHAHTAAARASSPDRYYHSPDSRISHHRPRHASGGGNASVFCDRRTASGGGMNCAAMVFAHRTLPLGSTHRLCSARGCVMARCVDRGPWLAGREFDLSPGLARALGVNGLGRVWRS
jgi:rare lipoprotein A (peptidoglycan hydrolase)